MKNFIFFKFAKFEKLWFKKKKKKIFEKLKMGPCQKDISNALVAYSIPIQSLDLYIVRQVEIYLNGCSRMLKIRNKLGTNKFFVLYIQCTYLGLVQLGVSHGT